MTVLRGVRPALMFTYWVNAVISHDDPYSYHVVNVIFHWISSVLVFLIVRLSHSYAPGQVPSSAQGNGLKSGSSSVHALKHDTTAAMGPTTWRASGWQEHDQLIDRPRGVEVCACSAAVAQVLLRREAAGGLRRGGPAPDGCAGPPSVTGT